MWPSKTDVACDCNCIQNKADNPDIPIEFDSRLSEYNFVFDSAGGKGRLLLRHCAFCGGKAPESKRALLFATISSKEQARLVALTKSLRTINDVLEALGKPDKDADAGLLVTSPEKDGKPAETQAYRVLVYTGLSETADVHVTVYPTDRVAVSFQGKYVGDKS